ncbi:MAG TPA: hypothetical protein VNK43_09035 [Gemmatimonadales bacterium]|nr:hypothetical protein [Gemmatimonadales bacterium]
MRLIRSVFLGASVLAGAAALDSARLAAQFAPECAGYSGQAENVCSAAVDATRAFHPVAGLLVSGGNPVLGTGRTLGGFPRFSFTARVNATEVVLPSLEYDGSDETLASEDEIVAPAPLVEASMGVFRGLGRGLLAVDLLGSAQLLPTNVVDNLSVDDDARRIGDVALGLGYGVRIGVLAGSFPIPSVSVSLMRRGVPRIQYGNLGDLSQDFQYAVDLDATNVRVVASEQIGVLTLAAGLGWDKYTGDAAIAFRHPLTGLPQAPIEIELDNSRTMAFLNAGLDLSVLKVVGELGYQGGKDQDLSTDFEGWDAEGGRLFGGVGLRFGF